MNRKKIRDTALTLALIFIISFMLNYIWESVHEAFLYEPCRLEVRKYIQMILYTAAVDASIILGLYIGVAVLWQDIHWLHIMNRRQIYLIFIVGIVIAALIEYRGSLVLGKWSYNSIMPTIFGIGLSPLLQLSTTGLMTFWVVRRILHQKQTC